MCDGLNRMFHVKDPHSCGSPHIASFDEMNASPSVLLAVKDAPIPLFLAVVLAAIKGCENQKRYAHIL
jgi:hypothetical protein